jgi:hypothetical protein
VDDDSARSPLPGPAGTPVPGRPWVPAAERSHELADAVRLALWFTAWCRGLVSPDETRDAVVGRDAAHDVVGLPGRERESVPLILALGALRAERAGAAGVALPVAGDPLGLAGPPGFNAEALEAGEAVVLTGAGLGLVPVRAGAGVVWRCLPAEDRRQVPDLAEADTELRGALPRAADALAALDVARWRPEVADELMALRRDQPLPVPGGMLPRAQRMLALATRCRTIVELALADDGAAVTAGEADARRAALLPLDRASRRAVVAACAHPFGG